MENDLFDNIMKKTFLINICFKCAKYSDEFFTQFTYVKFSVRFLLIESQNM